MTRAGDTGAEGRGAGPLGYHPSLDGVRALAIVLVMLFHTDKGGHVSLVPGGFLGVDVFFVLSGFLITSLLIDEYGANGRIRLGGFWGRRVARLLPLLWALLALMAFHRWIYQFRGLVPPSPLGFLALLGYVGNWIPATHHDGLGKVEYLWSLSVEEQFYVVWPLLVVAIFGLSGRAARRMRSRSAAPGPVEMSAGHVGIALAATTGAAAVMVARILTHTEVSYFFHTFLRSDGLLLGAALAATRPLWHRLRSGLSAGLVLGGATLVGWMVWTSHVGNPQVPTWRLPVLEIGVLALTAGLVARPAAALARAAGMRPLVWLGRRSYALYLVHVPVFDLVRVRVGETHPRMKALIGWPIALVVAHLAHIAIELPAQRRLRRALRAEHAGADPAPRDIEAVTG